MNTIRLPRSTSPSASRRQPPLARFLSIDIPPRELQENQPASALLSHAAAREAALIGGQVFGRVRPSKQNPFGIVSLAGLSAPPDTLSGARGLAVASTQVEPIRHRRRHVGWRFEDHSARYAYFPALPPPCRKDIPPDAQAQAWFENVEEVLQSAGFSFRDVVRTWFYLHRILDWYPAFNQIRNTFFEEREIFGGFVPVSTGVGISNPSGFAICCDILCIRPIDPRVTIEAVASPMQCPAFEYWSSFSRAAEISFPDRKWLMVSGTASIAPDGSSTHLRDAYAQVALSMEVVRTILASRRLTWDDVWRGVTYLRDPSIEDAFRRWLQIHRPQGLPLVPAVCEICRDELLFEIELDAVKPSRLPRGRA